jgi:hypothetical protein
MKLLGSLFESATKKTKEGKDKKHATTMKELGNQCLNYDQVEESIMYYTKSIVSISISFPTTILIFIFWSEL